jgi:hypothetical protein
MLEIWIQLTERYGRKRVILLTYLLGVGVIAAIMHFLMFNNLYHSSLLYVFIPYCISVVITFFRSYDKPKSHLQRFFSHVLTALSIFLSTSLLVGEGFVCIAFFAPIYLIVITASYLISSVTDTHHNGGNNKYSLAVPAIVLVLSLEGTTAQLSFPRDSFVEINRSTTLSIQQIKANLAKPFDLNKKRHWMISIFPMPYHIEAGSLNAGDVHTVYTRYHRWFVTNTHEGQAELLIESVSANKVKTKVLSDTTYFSTYLQGSGTEISLLPNAQGGTDIKLRIDYQRKLDPAWYFHPLQKFGISKMGELIIDELMIRG